MYFNGHDPEEIAKIDNVTPEMIDGAKVYQEAIDSFWKDANPNRGEWSSTEWTISLKGITEEDGKGTADYIGVSRAGVNEAAENAVLITDYKYGLDPVDIKDNLQLWLYMAAYITENADRAWSEYTFTCMIVQPRIHAISQQTKSYSELMDIAQFLKTCAKRAMIEMELPEEYRTFNPCKENCQYCKGAGICKAQANAIINYTGIKEEIALGRSQNQDLAQVYSHAEEIKKYIEQVEELVKTKLSEGEQIPGFKLVKGRNLPKRWLDENATAEFLGKYLAPDEIFVKKLISPTQAEKLIKSAAAEYKNFARENVIIPPGNPTIAPESDKREAIRAQPANTPTKLEF